MPKRKAAESVAEPVEAVGPKKSAKKASKTTSASTNATSSSKATNGSITVEHCKSWGLFKTKAGQLDRALKGLGSSVTLSVNQADFLTASAGKPRKGITNLTLRYPSLLI